MTPNQSNFQPKPTMELFGVGMFPVGLIVGIITMMPLPWKLRLAWARFLSATFYRDYPQRSTYISWVAYCNRKYRYGKPSVEHYVLAKELQKRLQALDEQLAEQNAMSEQKKEELTAILSWVLSEYERLSEKGGKK
jgi:hypothetical protein